MAYQALKTEIEIGLLMPCNVIVYEADNGRTMVSIADPMAMLGIAAEPDLYDMAKQAKLKLMDALAELDSLADPLSLV